MSVKLNVHLQRSVDKIGYGKGKTTGSVPANNIPSLGIVGVASGQKPAEVSTSVKPLARQPDDLDPDDPDAEEDDDVEERTPRKK